MKIFASIFVGLSLMSTVALAKEKTAKSTYRVPYGMNGCGLWSLIIKDKDQGSQLGIFALKTFVFPDFQTSAISTGSSNCVHAGSQQAMTDEQSVFVQVNLETLEKEAAQGQGEMLESLSELLGCSDHKSFAQWTQSNYHTIFSNRDPEQVINNYRTQLYGHEQSFKCSRLQS